MIDREEEKKTEVFIITFSRLGKFFSKVILLASSFDFLASRESFGNCCVSLRAGVIKYSKTATQPTSTPMIMLMGFTAHVCVCVYLSLATRTSWEYPEYINTWRLDVVFFFLPFVDVAVT